MYKCTVELIFLFFYYYYFFRRRLSRIDQDRFPLVQASERLYK
jgi:hypothetical protein